MSQRLCIGPPPFENYYDLVIESSDDSEQLVSEWLMSQGRIYFGPWKIRLVDLDLWEQVKGDVAEVLVSRGNSFPDCVWYFYHNEDCIEHPTGEELEAWIKEIAK